MMTLWCTLGALTPNLLAATAMQTASFEAFPADWKLLGGRALSAKILLWFVLQLYRYRQDTRSWVRFDSMGAPFPDLDRVVMQ